MQSDLGWVDKGYFLQSANNTIEKHKHTPATYLGPWLSSGRPCPCNLQRLRPISLALLLEDATIFSAEYLALHHIRDFEVGLPSRRPDIMTEVINEFL